MNVVSLLNSLYPLYVPDGRAHITDNTVAAHCLPFLHFTGSLITGRALIADS